MRDWPGKVHVQTSHYERAPAEGRRREEQNRAKDADVADILRAQHLMMALYVIDRDGIDQDCRLANGRRIECQSFYRAVDPDRSPEDDSPLTGARLPIEPH